MYGIISSYRFIHQVDEFSWIVFDDRTGFRIAESKLTHTTLNEAKNEAVKFAEAVKAGELSFYWAEGANENSSNAGYINIGDHHIASACGDNLFDFKTTKDDLVKAEKVLRSLQGVRFHVAGTDFEDEADLIHWRGPAGDVTKCFDGAEHDFSNETLDQLTFDKILEVVGTTFACSKCALRFDDFMDAVDAHGAKGA